MLETVFGGSNFRYDDMGTHGVMWLHGELLLPLFIQRRLRRGGYEILCYEYKAFSRKLFCFIQPGIYVSGPVFTDAPIYYN